MIANKVYSCAEIEEDFNESIQQQFDDSDNITDKGIADYAEKRLEGKGRILLRKSGTEPLIRVMVECEDGALAKQCAEEIAEAVKAN